MDRPDSRLIIRMRLNSDRRAARECKRTKNCAGIARMRIVSPEMREKIHGARVKEGVKGYVMKGSRKVAEATIIRVVGLGENER